MQFSASGSDLKIQRLQHPDSEGTVIGLDDAICEAQAFCPDIVWFRPDSRSKPLLALMDLIDGPETPVALVILDAWIGRLRTTDGDAASMWTAALRDWSNRAAIRFAVSKEMAEMLEAEYEAVFDVISNWVDLWSYPLETKFSVPNSVEFLHSGALTGDKGGATAALLGTTFANRNDNAAELVLQVPDHPAELRLARTIAELHNTKSRDAPIRLSGYRRSLIDADVNVVVFDFTSVSIDYLRFSFANRIPELLAAGRPILAVGPPSILNIEYLRSSGAAIVVDQPSYADISAAIEQLTSDAELRRCMGNRARELAGTYDASLLRPIFHRKIRNLVKVKNADVRDLRQRNPTDPRLGEEPLILPEIPKSSALASFIKRHRHSLAGRHIDEAEREPDQGDLDILDSLRSRHAGETCVIVGNGPSLNQTDLSLLNDQIIFASNGIFLLFEEVAWRPQYYAAVDSRFVPDRCDDVNAMLRDCPETLGFFPTTLTLHDGSKIEKRTRELLQQRPNRILFRQTKRDPRDRDWAAVSLDARRGLVAPSTVTVTLLQLAAHMGFGRMVLIGCDTSYSVPDTVIKSGPNAPNQGGEKMLMESTVDDDPNHFRPDYFGTNRKWHHPKVDYMIAHYEATKLAFDRYGIDVVNSTVGGSLEVFPRAPLDLALGS